RARRAPRRTGPSPRAGRRRAGRASGPMRRRGSGLLGALLRAPRCAGAAGGRLGVTRLLLLGLLLVVLAAIVGDVEARASEDESGATGRDLARPPAAARALLDAPVVDAMEHLELMPALATAVAVGRHRSVPQRRRSRMMLARARLGRPLSAARRGERAGDGGDLHHVGGAAATREVVGLEAQAHEDR